MYVTKLLMDYSYISTLCFTLTYQFSCHYSAECSLFRVAVHPSTYTGVETIITTPTSGSIIANNKGVSLLTSIACNTTIYHNC